MPSKNGETRQLFENLKTDGEKLYKKVKMNPLISLCFIIAVLLLIIVPYLQVDYQGVSNSTAKATLENQYRATLAQVFGGAAIAISLYYTWRRIEIADEDLKYTKENLKVNQEGQITERFTRAVDQLGSKNLQIRLGGIYALERIANESDKDYWPIMEIFAAYIRTNSPFKNKDVRLEIYENIRNINTDVLSLLELRNKLKVPLDVETVINILKTRKYRQHSFRDANYSNDVETIIDKLNDFFRDTKNLTFDDTNSLLKSIKDPDLKFRLNEINSFFDYNQGKLRESRCLDLQRTYLLDVNLDGAHLENACLAGSFLCGSSLRGAHFELSSLHGAVFKDAHLENDDFGKALLIGANFERAYLKGAIFEEADLQEANLRGAHDLSVDQLSKAKTLYDAELDEELRVPLKEKYPTLFDNPNL